ncbi:biopolymer transporter ExbD [bacterium]|nr:biopolymer transporter ExbD [bacterium]
MSRRDKYETSAQMNLTSMVDILFMLLIIVMITAPIMHAQVDLSLPKSSAAHITDESAVTISVKSNGTVYIEKSQITLDNIPKKLWELKQTKNLKSVALRADKKVDYGTIMKVIGAIKDGGIEDLGLVALPEHP